MKLYIGGFAEGKLEYVMNSLSTSKTKITDEHNYRELLDKDVNEGQYIIWNHFHLCVKDMLKQADINITEVICKIIKEYPDIIIISDEIGCGVVPLDREEREYRELTGRLLTDIAGKAKAVERIICGIGVKIK